MITGLLQTRLKEALLACLGNRRGRIGIAFSGGVDSFALLNLVSSIPELDQVYAFTVNHQYRPESSDEAQQIHAIVRSTYKRVHHSILTADWTRYSQVQNLPQKSSFEWIARTERYRLLYEACRIHATPILLVAHHLNDQVETGLMRLAKGSGIEGLAGMHNISSIPVANAHDFQITVLRPLLRFRKLDLYDYCAQENVKWFEDPTNADTDHRRNLLRAFFRELDGSSSSFSTEAFSAFMDRMGSHKRFIDARVDQLQAANIFRPISGDDSIILLHLPGDVSDAFKRRLMMRTLYLLYGALHIRLEKQLQALKKLNSRNVPAFTLGSCVFRRFEPTKTQLRKINGIFKIESLPLIKQGNAWTVTKQIPKIIKQT